MAITQATPYLFFNGDAAQAVALYEKALGARTEGLMRYGEAPEGAMDCPPGDKERIAHAMLHVGEATLMLSDRPGAMDEPAQPNVHILLDFDDVDEMTRKFRALAEGGTVQMDLHDAFWGARFGVLIDAHNIQWMFSCAQEAR